MSIEPEGILISNLRPEDSGLYECQAKNDFGSVKMVIQLFVTMTEIDARDFETYGYFTPKPEAISFFSKKGVNEVISFVYRRDFDWFEVTIWVICIIYFIIMMILIIHNLKRCSSSGHKNRIDSPLLSSLAKSEIVADSNLDSVVISVISDVPDLSLVIPNAPELSCDEFHTMNRLPYENSLCMAHHTAFGTIV